MSTEKSQRIKLSENFYEDEFWCFCYECSAEQWMNEIFIDKLQAMRTDLDRPFQINSGARCFAYNARVGGAPKSGHLVSPIQPARAADISTLNWTSEAKHRLVRAAYKYGMRGIGISETFIHVDDKKRKALWVY